MDLNTAKSTLENLITQKQSELASLTLSLSVLNSTFAPDLSALKQAQDEADTQRTKVSEQADTITSITAEKETLQTQYESLQTENTSLQTDKDSLQATNDSLQTENESLKTQNDSLQTQIAAPAPEITPESLPPEIVPTQDV